MEELGECGFRILLYKYVLFSMRNLIKITNCNYFSRVTNILVGKRLRSDKTTSEIERTRTGFLTLTIFYRVFACRTEREQNVWCFWLFKKKIL